MAEIKQASSADYDRLKSLFDSDNVIEKDGSLYATAESMPFLAQFGIESYPASEAGPGMHWINQNDLVDVFSRASRAAKA